MLRARVGVGVGACVTVGVRVCARSYDAWNCTRVCDLKKMNIWESGPCKVQRVRAVSKGCHSQCRLTTYNNKCMELNTQHPREADFRVIRAFWRHIAGGNYRLNNFIFLDEVHISISEREIGIMAGIL